MLPYYISYYVPVAGGWKPRTRMEKKVKQHRVGKEKPWGLGGFSFVIIRGAFLLRLVWLPIGIIRSRGGKRGTADIIWFLKKKSKWKVNLTDGCIMMYLSAVWFWRYHWQVASGNYDDTVNDNLAIFLYYWLSPRAAEYMHRKYVKTKTRAVGGVRLSLISCLEFNLYFTDFVIPK
jgi:hypothetical protein